MNDQTVKSVFSQVLISSAVLIGAYMLAVDPMKKELASTKAYVEEAANAPDDLEGVSPAERISASKTQREVIERLGSPVPDQSAMFTRISELAINHDLRLDALDPTEYEPPPELLDLESMDGDGEAPPRNDQSLAYTMSVIGSYAKIAGFISALHVEAGFTRIRTIDVTAYVSETGGDLVAAFITTEHHAFDATPLFLPETQDAPPPAAASAH